MTPKTYQPYSHVHKRNNIRPDYKTFPNINQVNFRLPKIPIERIGSGWYASLHMFIVLTSHIVILLLSKACMGNIGHIKNILL